VLPGKWSLAIAPLLLAGCASTPDAPSAAETFERHCASCHGTLADGNGPVASEMRIDVPDLTGLSARNGGVFPTDLVASYIDGRAMPAAHGNRLMPIWGTVFETTARIVAGAPDARTRIDEIVAHLRRIQRP
jgi:mono/diheme cytochrome c family protein